MKSSCVGMPRGRHLFLALPGRELDLGGSQRVGEDERTLLRQPERRLVAAPSVVEGDEAARKLGAGLDPFELGLRNVGAPEEIGAERANAVAADEVVDIV